MKKIFVCLFAVAALASCQKDQVLESVVGPAIAFENASVDNATRAAVDPSTTTATINKFSVWGYMDERNGAIFNEEIVSKSGSDWTYANTQYWLAGHTYYFGALSATYAEDGETLKDIKVTPETSVEAADYGLGTVKFTNTDGTNDLLYAAQKVEAAADADLSAMPKVGLAFSHLLSKVKFTFTNGFENPNSTLKITGLTMTAPAAGTIDLNVENWWDNDDWKLDAVDPVTLAFGNVEKGANIASGASVEGDNERLTIPAAKTQEYVVKFHVQLYNGEVLAVENDIETVVTGVALEMGKAYNFQAEINASNIMGPDQELYPIEFEVIVKDWVEAENVATELEKVEVAKGESLTLVTDAVAASTVAVAGTLDGAGHTIKVDKGSADYLSSNMLKFIELNGGNAILKNAVVDGNNATYDADGDASTTEDIYGIRNIVVTESGNYLIDNVQSINATYPLHVSTTAAVNLTVVNSEFYGWLSYNAETTADFQGVTFGAANGYARIRPYGTTTFTNCVFPAGYIIDFSKLAAGKKVTFINCTYDGAALKASNLTDAAAGTYEIK